MLYYCLKQKIIHVSPQVLDADFIQNQAPHSNGPQTMQDDTKKKQYR